MSFRSLDWMNGRLVFRRPESRPSNVSKRCIIESNQDRGDLTRAYITSTLARHSLTLKDIEEEIAAFREWEERDL